MIRLQLESNIQIEFIEDVAIRDKTTLLFQRHKQIVCQSPA
jgi:hypothetical protein